jgi:hypothetical protein
MVYAFYIQIWNGIAGTKKKKVSLFSTMPSKKRFLAAAAARAREGRAQKSHRSDEECEWTGGVNHILSSDSEFHWTDSDTDTDSESDFSELEGQELIGSLQACLDRELAILGEQTPYDKLSQQTLTTKAWKEAEAKRGFGYTGNSDRTRRRKDKEARKKGEKDAILRKRWDTAFSS